mmetsp:Transcript_111464/g.288162  ORF Transcript_111464/g.288162 Transcript_111464/m.288162 type:complete len:251 (-) Transcript_111464:104-856(-)
MVQLLLVPGYTQAKRFLACFQTALFLAQCFLTHFQIVLFLAHFCFEGLNQTAMLFLARFSSKTHFFKLSGLSQAARFSFAQVVATVVISSPRHLAPMAIASLAARASDGLRLGPVNNRFCILSNNAKTRLVAARTHPSATTNCLPQPPLLCFHPLLSIAASCANIKVMQLMRLSFTCKGAITVKEHNASLHTRNAYLPLTTQQLQAIVTKIFSLNSEAHRALPIPHLRVLGVVFNRLQTGRNNLLVILVK